MGTARESGALVLLGRCVDVGDGELAYAPIAGALRSLVAQVDEADLGAALHPGRAEIARLVPELAGENGRPDAGPAPFGRARLFELLLGALGRLGNRRPVVLVIEDLHWADGSTRDLLRFLVRAAAGERLALIATCRTDDLHRAHTLRPYLVELRRDAHVQSLDLEPFSRDELADHVAAIVGTLPSPASLDRLGFPFHASVCSWREAEALLLAGADRERAADVLGDAARQAGALGAHPLAAAVDALARRARLAVGVAEEGAPEERPAGLSPRELEVLCLLAEGHTNREVGAELFISEKTVSAHVSRILAKLGAANRAEAATIAHRLGVAARLS